MNLPIEHIDDISMRATYSGSLGSNVVTRKEIVLLCADARELHLMKVQLQGMMVRADDALETMRTVAESVTLDRTLKRTAERERAKAVAANDQLKQMMDAARRQQTLLENVMHTMDTMGQFMEEAIQALDPRMERQYMSQELQARDDLAKKMRGLLDFLHGAPPEAVERSGIADSSVCTPSADSVESSKEKLP